MQRHRSWEDRCQRCGRCCYEKIDFEGTIYYTNQACPFLDLQSRLCTVYPERHQHRADCTPLTPRILSAGMLPADCPYVAHRRDYRAPKLWGEEE